MGGTRADTIIGLLCEDTGDRELLAGFLRDSGYGIRTDLDCSASAAGWEQIALVIADVRAARTVGGDLLRLKQDADTIFLPMLVALPGDGVEVEWLEAGFDDVLRLPISKIELDARVRVMLRQRRHAVDQHWLERALKRSEELARKVFESSRDCIDVLDVDGRLVSTNPTAVGVFKTCGTVQWAGASWTDLWSNEYRDLARAAVDAALAGGVGRLTALGRSAPNSTKWWSVIVTPILGAGEEPERLLAVSRDITDEMLLAEERERLLAQEQKAREQAELAGRIKDEFLTTVSHELRTPLNAALGWVHILENAQHGEGIERRATATIRRNIEAQAQIVEDLLDISRITSGKLRVESRSVDLPTVVRAALESAQPAAKNKGVRIRLTAEADVPSVLGDKNRLQQVVWNLLSNAIKFTPRDGRVEVGLEHSSENVRISVADTGRGITPGFLPYVFDRFRQADGSATRTEGGLGLGLAIVREIVTLHGGTVEAVSKGPGKGATFTVGIPVPVSGVDGEGVDGQPEVAPPAADERVKTLAGVRALVVEDAVDSREMLEIVLADAGAQVHSCASVREAFDAFATQPPDVIVCDIGLPGDDGYSLIAKVREHERDTSRTTPAIALTAFARVEDRQRAIAEGFQRHLAKPVGPGQLVSVIRELVDGRSAGG